MLPQELARSLVKRFFILLRVCPRSSTHQRLEIAFRALFLWFWIPKITVGKSTRPPWTLLVRQAHGVCFFATRTTQSFEFGDVTNCTSLQNFVFVTSFI